MSRRLLACVAQLQTKVSNLGVIVSFQQIDTVAADQAVASPMRRLGM